MKTVLMVLLSIAATTTAYARPRDPLTSKEVTEMRDSAQDGDQRLKLLARFARARLVAIDQLHGDAKISDRNDQIHDLLDDFTSIVTELDRNVDMYSRERYDLRKGLKIEVEALTEFQLKLRALKQNSTGPELHDYGFALDSALDEVNANLDSARETMDAQVKQHEEDKKQKH